MDPFPDFLFPLLLGQTGSWGEMCVVFPMGGAFYEIWDRFLLELEHHNEGDGPAEDGKLR
jgi:hypothetical protein